MQAACLRANSPTEANLPAAPDPPAAFATDPDCTWVITGRTGAHARLRGSGTCFGNDENTLPWINHSEQGRVWDQL